MKRIFIKKVLCFAFAITILSSVSVQTFAASVSEDIKVNEIKQKQIEFNHKISKIIDNDYGSVKFENTTIRLDLDYIKSNNIDVNSQEFEREVINEVYVFKKQLEDSIKANKLNRLKNSSPKNSVPSITAGTESYERTASVWCGVPAIGWAYINQDYKVTIRDDAYYESVEFLGDSYKTGIALGSWTHIRSWYELGYYKTYADIHIKGVLDYSLKSGIISTEATFLYTDNEW